MTKIVKRRRGTATEHASFTGSNAEITVNTTNKSLHVHDAVTAGGFEQARADLSNVLQTTLAASLVGASIGGALTVTGAMATGALTVTGLSTFNGNIVVTGTVDGRDVAADGIILDALKVKTDWITISQAVDLDALETRVNALSASIVLKGSWDASAGTFPTSTVAGESWIVSVGGTVNSQVFTANDRIVAIANNASTTIYANNWFKLDYTDQVLSVAGKTGAVSLVKLDITDLNAYEIGGVDVAVLDGGTGASTASGARTNLGLIIGTNIQAYTSILQNTTASYTTTSETKLAGIEVAATADQTPAQILAAIKAVDGTTSGLDADLLDGNHSTAFATSAQGTKVDFLTITQAVDLDTIEARVNALDSAVVLKGGWDASVGTFPGIGAALVGESWQVTVAGVVGGETFSVNDRIIALTLNASTTVYANNWLKADYTDQVASVVGQTGIVTATQIATALGGTTVGGTLTVSGNIEVSNAAGGAIFNEAATSTNPTIVPNKADVDTGLGWFSTNQGALIAAGVTILTFNNSIIDPRYHIGRQLAGAPLIEVTASSTTIPGFTFWGDVDTGLGLGGVNELSLITGGTSRIYINSTGQIGIGTVTANAAEILTIAGDVYPKTDIAYDLGSPIYRWSNIYTTDLQLSNIGKIGNEIDGTSGSWTLQEGADQLFIINRITHKKYMINMTEVI